MKPLSYLLAVTALTIPSLATAHSIKSETGGQVAAFDIVETTVTSHVHHLVFSMATEGLTGSLTPTATGALEGSDVYAYVWPTGLDSATVGFEPGQGILAFTVTAHPDFDDTPLFDENADGDLGNDGSLWHSHWVVLTKDEACGPGGLKVKDIPEGAKPALPATWPGLPLLIDSPGWSPKLSGNRIEVHVPFNKVGTGLSENYDGVTSALRVNKDLHNPLLCVSDVFDIASGDLSLPGVIRQHTDQE